MSKKIFRREGYKTHIKLTIPSRFHFFHTLLHLGANNVSEKGNVNNPGDLDSPTMAKMNGNWLVSDVMPKKSVEFMRGITPVNGTPVRQKPKRGISVESRTSVIKTAFGQLYENKTRPNLLNNYFVGNELHGIKQALNADNRLYQIVWFTGIIIILIIATNATRRVVSEFFLKQTATSYSIKHAQRLEFPSVIVCPKNPDALVMHEVEAEIRRHVPNIDNKTIYNLIGYAIADAGFANIKLSKMTDEQHEEMIHLLKKWRGSRSTHGFYTNLFERHGYTCEDMFSDCRHGAEPFPCCQLFTQHYVMLRGRCFRLERLFQTDPDYQGRLYLGMNRLPSPLIEKNKIQPQIIAYIADPGSEMAMFPRFYLNYHAFNYVSVTMRRINMLPTSTQCFNSDETRGRSACYLRRWLHTRLIEPFNCTLFYMHYRTPYAEICGPGVVAKHYNFVQDVTLNGSKCLPSCLRHDRRYTFSTNEAKRDRLHLFEQKMPEFGLELGYVDLEYESFDEFSTTSVPGFISEVGGHFGLFAGVTIITVIQLMLNLLMLIEREISRLHRFIRKNRLNSVDEQIE